MFWGDCNMKSIRRTINSVIAELLCAGVLLGMFPIYAVATDLTIGQQGGYLAGSVKAVQNLYLQRNFSAPAGHGFVAEQANNLSDQWRGRNAEVIGGNNQKNGADRQIINRDHTVTYIQDKYYQTAAKTISSAFDSETSLYKYMNVDGTPMMLEVPADQYDDVVRIMRQKISDGKVPGVTDPLLAENYVKKGAYTFEQVKNIAKPGNIDSLKYDVKNGVVVATSALGIGFVLDYVSCKTNGEDNLTALRNASWNGLKTGGFIMVTYVVSSQLARTGLKGALAPTTDAIAKSLGKGVSEAILNTFGQEAKGLSTQQIATKVSSILQNQIITSGVVIAALSVGDIYDLFRGRISPEQLLKNLTVTISSTGGTAIGGVAGNVVGNAVLPGVGGAVGTFAGGMLGGVAGGYAAGAIVGNFIKDDADEMYQIMEDQFNQMSVDYLVNEEESIAILDSIVAELEGDTLKEMYASENREAFAVNLMQPLFEKQIREREKITIPLEEDVRAEMKNILQGVVKIH